MRGRVTEILGIKYPILQGGMAWVSTASLVAAVSEAGGLGIIGAGGMRGEDLQEEIRKTKSLTNQPFGVNLMLLSAYVEEQIQVIKEEKIPVVTTGAGNPGRLVEDLAREGILTIPVVSSVALARRLVRYGIKLIIAEGMEAGGHIGEITTMCLVPQIVDAVSPLPVIAAGGIADGRGMAACFALGAEGVQMGTRFVCTEECEVHPLYKEAIVKAQDRSTVVTGTTTGHPVRCLRNRLTRKFEELETRRAPVGEMEALGSGRLREAVCGNVEEGSVMSGQIAGLVKDIKPVQQVIEDIIEEFEETIRKLSHLVED
ncbi:MAG TPA: enoyl-[acyl-carrier-protein] reductase FabK [Candidatus Atribacteria bacterium]|nr:enoyl-[acyl-carrier-protein] reductase FabK [Candidatus Atribacteria bacterium]